MTAIGAGRRTVRSIGWAVAAAILLALLAWPQTPAPAFGPSNPFYAPSTLPYQAPPFDKIHDSDYQPAIEAGIAEETKEIDVIVNNPAHPDFANTFVPLEKSGQLLDRVEPVFSALISANSNADLEKIEQAVAPKLSALSDSITLNPMLFARIQAIYNQRDKLGLDAEAKRVVERTFERFTLAGAALSEADRNRLKQINEQLSILETAFGQKLRATAVASAFATADKNALAGLSDGQIAAAEALAKQRKQPGYVLALQNTTQQPALQQMTDRTARKALFDAGWNRAEHGDANDTRETVARIASLRADKAKLLGYPSYGAWVLKNQMAKTPEAVFNFLAKLAPPAVANANAEAKEIQATIDAQKGGFTLAPYDWQFYAEQVRKAKYNLDEAMVRPYFELNRVLQDGVFYAATQLYGITFTERKDIPVYHPDVRVFEVKDADGKPMALFYCDYFQRESKRGGAWSTSFVAASKLTGNLPVISNVGNFSKPAPGEPALIGYDNARTMFHEFGHALNSFFVSVTYPSLRGLPRDFTEVPSQFNEHWRDDPKVFAHFARHYKTGEVMPADLQARLRKAQTFGQGYALTELLAATEIDLAWHALPAGAPAQVPVALEQSALAKAKLALAAVPPRYRSSYFLHVWANGYESRYYAYLWSEMYDNDAYAWFTQHGGLTRANGDRFRSMILSRGNSADLATTYEAWRGAPPTIDAMLEERGLKPAK